MLELAEALELVLQHTHAGAVERVPGNEALGRRLAEDIASDVDVPPYDKSIVDGFALRADDLRKGRGELQIVEEIFAGSVPHVTVQSGQTSRITTGAPIPAGADCVVMVERTELKPDSSPLGRVAIDDEKLSAGANIMRRAASVKRGEHVLRRGHALRAIELGVLADAGRATVDVYRRPRVAVLATGSELVPVDQSPGPGQIRNSNSWLLAASIAECGATADELGIARDEPTELRAAVARGLQADVFVLSGGVSVGERDLTPGILAEAGVVEVFHKVRLKPGKPIWFGVLRAGERTTLVFGLPGNPVSSCVSFQWFVRPALDRLQGGPGETLPRLVAELDGEFKQRGERETFRPAQLIESGDAPVARLLRWEGSGDLARLAAANCLVRFPAGDRHFKAGDQVEAYRLPGR